ncbi:uncharacterized protein LOC131232768 [Magnolia sinica]|uniref:uncharacterized protein LOC131232768 n=1 Tax=Magnolia sinica TaxID=86752 RepID=UPI002658E363|nr:uncharacterized protein LOC131232768 [Magnolia sinica]
MVGIFSRISGIRTGHRRSQTAVYGRETVPPNAESTSSVAAAAAAHGLEVAVEFKPVEHPIEPLDTDQPVRCPLPEPSILNDGTIWKERLSASMGRRSDLPVVREGVHSESEAAAGTKPRSVPARRSRLPSSISAPENDLINMLEECRAAAD